VSAAAYGIPLALATTLAFNTGLILEKRALGRMSALNLREVRQVIASLLANPAWAAGFALVLTGLACQVIVLAFEPISLVQPIVASGLALSLLLSRLVLRERLGGAESRCVIAVAVSVILIALSQGGQPTQATRPAGAVAMTAVMVPTIGAGLLIAAWPLLVRRGKHRGAAIGTCAGLGTGLLYGVVSLTTKGLSGILARDHTAVSIAGGILASPYLYLLAGCSVIALLLYQAALQAWRASILIPVSSIVSSMYFVIAGTWLFHEQLPASPGRLAARLVGMAIAGLVLVILPGQAQRPQPARVPGVPASRAGRQARRGNGPGHGHASRHGRSGRHRPSHPGTIRAD
jgi:hypothetical protein